MTSSDNTSPDTPPGVQYLRKIWQISESGGERAKPPREVNSDIYNIPQSRPRHKRRHMMR